MYLLSLPDSLTQSYTRLYLLSHYIHIIDDYFIKYLTDHICHFPSDIMLMVGGLNTGITHNTLANISIQPFCSEHLCLFLFSGSEYVQDVC